MPCLSFTKANSSYVSCGTNTNLNLITEMTYSYWYKYSANPASTAAIGGKLQGMPYIDTTGQHRNDITYTGAAAYFPILATAGVNTKNVWHHGVMTHSNTDGASKVYFDGVLKATNTTIGSGLTTRPTLNFCIGARPNASNIILDFFDGLIDDFRVYNKALSLAEISLVRELDASVASANLVSWWKLNENTGTTTADDGVLGGANDGTLTFGSGGSLPTWSSDTPNAVKLRTATETETIGETRDRQKGAWRLQP